MEPIAKSHKLTKYHFFLRTPPLLKLQFTYLISIAFAAPNGYNYAAQNYNTGSFIQHPHHQHAYSALNSPPVQQFLTNHATGFQAGPSYQQFNHLSNGGGFSHHSGQHHVQQQPIVTKHIYIHSAPEEPDEEVYEDNSTHQQHKHYNIVFIKAPSQAVRKTAQTLANVLNEQKTIIYVLSKKNDYSEIKQAIQSIPHQPQKPEVYFIKYKTPEEAQLAQNTIQAQYDALGGTTKISDEGYAPVSAVNSGSANLIIGGSPYLPPNKVEGLKVTKV
ncbi:uncharacterized protein LOC129613928 [Condylostylus longicornis]|uniref:uncharacterized protein LOC129613928 n=1 Tax=Condylostylus longicornis TaxID=2530218 RepID=UPI00244DF853|nr:uncharacterized protein LOC129613928 [Condylostylus longicornis]